MTLLHRQPRFIPCIYALYGPWPWARLWRKDANARRRRRRIYSSPTPTPTHQGLLEGCVAMLERKGSAKPTHEMCYGKLCHARYTAHPVDDSRWPRDGTEHQSAMGSRSRRNAEVLASEPWLAIPVDCGRRVVEKRLGLTHQTQDGQ